MKTKPNKFSSFMFYFSMTIYIIFLIYALFLKVVPLGMLFNSNREFIRSVTIKPFYTIGNYLNVLGTGFRGFAMHNLLGNILLFFPMGIYFELLRKKSNIFLSLLSIILVSIGVEIVQYIFGLGITDIDDVILNFLGGLIGVLLYRIAFLFVKDKDKMKKIITVMASLMVIALLILVFMFMIFGIRFR